MNLVSFTDHSSMKDIHSSGLASTNDGSRQSLAASRHETYEQRMKVDRSRQHVDSYYNSSLVKRREGFGAPARRGDNTRASSEPRFRQPLSGNRSGTTRVSAGFYEPTSRNYDPFR